MHNDERQREPGEYDSGPEQLCRHVSHFVREVHEAMDGRVLAVGHPVAEEAPAEARGGLTG